MHKTHNVLFNKRIYKSWPCEGKCTLCKHKIPIDTFKDSDGKSYSCI